jgi:dienelactone hydrolase
MRRLLSVVIASLIAFDVSAAIIEETVAYQAENDVTLKGFIAYDDSIQGKRPGVLVVHEWWGHNQYARERARLLAEAGYVGFALDMYGEGKQAAHPQDAQKFSSEISRNLPLAKARFRAAMQKLQSHPKTDDEHIAAIGYCFGGGVALQMAREGVNGLDAVASFHGALDTAHPAQSGAVKAKILVAHGAADPFVPPEKVAAFMKEMNEAGADYTFIAYSGAVHSFTNPEADKFGSQFNLPLKYNKQADVASWQAMRNMFNEALK